MSSKRDRKPAKKCVTADGPAVTPRAGDVGLLSETQQVGACQPAKPLKQAHKRTGISSTTDLPTVACADVAVQDGFAKAFIAARGKLEPDLDIGF